MKKRGLSRTILNFLVVATLPSLGACNSNSGSSSFDLTRGLVASYGFSENTGSSTGDGSGFNNTLTLTNTTWGTGHSGQGLLFNGTSSQTISATSSSLTPTNNLFTVMAWVYPTTDPGSGEHMIMSIEYSIGGYPISLVAFDYLANSGKPSCSRESGGGFTPAAVGLSKLTINTWTHVACIYNGVNLTLYINGVAVNTVAASGVLNTGSNYIDVGWSHNDAGDYFQGTLDEVRYFTNRVLTANEILYAMITPP